MPSIGRNDPCPCGSGKKYKACHLDQDEALRRAPGEASNEPDTPRTRVIDALTEFAGREFRSVSKKARELFPSLSDFDDGPETLSAEESGDWMFRLLYGSLFDLAAHPDGETIGEAYSRRYASRLDAAGRAWLSEIVKAPLTPYEVVEIQLDRGLRLKSLWDGQEIFVTERMGTHDLGVWEILAGRVIGDGDRLVLDGSAYRFPPSHKAILEEAIVDFRQGSGQYGTEGPPSSRRLLSPIIHLAWTELMLDAVNAPPPRVVTAEGDDVELTTTVFEMADADAIKTALRRRDDLEAESPSRFVWLESDGKGGRRILGSISIRGARLTFETMSKPRADRGRELLLGLVPGGLSMLRSKSMSARAVTAGSKGQSQEDRHEPKATGIPADMAAQVMREFLDRHYRDWIDHPLPALNGETPRNAARTAAGRREVVNVLKTMESHETRSAHRGQDPYDFGWIWKELRLPRS